MTARSYRRLLYRVPAEQGEALAAWLWVAGSLGLQELAEVDGPSGIEARIEAYFEPGAAPGEPPPGLGARLVEGDELPVVDWLETYRRLAQPLEIGRRLLIDPRELADGEDLPHPGADDAERILLHIPARSAFGTGSHESTRLVLELLEDLPLAGCRVLDVGTGSGILALAALALGARFAVGFDIDAESVLLAGQNGRLNLHLPSARAGRIPAFAVGGIEILRPEPRFDLALVNILPERMLPWIDLLPARLVDGAAALFSGILEEVAPPVLERLAELGFTPEESRRAGEWIAYRCRFTAPEGR